MSWQPKIKEKGTQRIRKVAVKCARKNQRGRRAKRERTKNQFHPEKTLSHRAKNNINKKSEKTNMWWSPGRHPKREEKDRGAFPTKKKPGGNNAFRKQKKQNGRKAQFALPKYLRGKKMPRVRKKSVEQGKSRKAPFRTARN